MNWQRTTSCTTLPMPEDEPEHPKHDILDEPPDEVTPDGRPIPKGHHWDGIRIVKDYKGSKRPKGISSDFWRSIGPKDRKKLIEEEEAAQRAKSAAAAAEGKTPSKRQQRRERRQRRLEVTSKPVQGPRPRANGRSCQQPTHTFRWCQQCLARGPLQSSNTEDRFAALSARRSASWSLRTRWSCTERWPGSSARTRSPGHQKLRKPSTRNG